MATKQVNLKLSDTLYRDAQKYASLNGFRNIQDFASESMRKKIYGEREYDESFTEREIKLIDALIAKTLKEGNFVSEKELRRLLK